MQDTQVKQVLEYIKKELIASAEEMDITDVDFLKKSTTNDVSFPYHFSCKAIRLEKALEIIAKADTGEIL